MAESRMAKRGRIGRLRSKRRLYIWAMAMSAVSLVVLLLKRFAPLRPDIVERVYSRFIYPLLAQPVSLLFGVFPFSFAEMLLLAGPLVFVLVIFTFIRRMRRNGESIKTAALRLVCGLIVAVCTAYLMFDVGWGFNYARLPLAEISGYEVRPSSPEELADLCMALMCEANELRQELPSSPSGMVLQQDGNVALMRRVNEAYAAVSGEMPWLSGRFAQPKPVILSEYLCWAGISGIFIPITFEANVNVLETPLFLAGTAAHEAAHLRGFAREDEANAIAYFVCRSSPHDDIRYSGTVLALVHSMNALHSADPDLHRLVDALYSPELRLDIDIHSAYWHTFDGPVQEAQVRVNDAYLRSNHQTEGVRSYGRMVDILLAEFRGGDGLRGLRQGVEPPGPRY